MNPIQNYALIHGEIDKTALAGILDGLAQVKAINLDHVLSIILGLKNTMPVIPVNSKIHGNECQMTGYDYLKDIVAYEYDNETDLYFSTQEGADTFSSNGNYHKFDYAFTEREGYPFRGVRVTKDNSQCSREAWLEGAEL